MSNLYVVSQQEQVNALPPAEGPTLQPYEAFESAGSRRVRKMLLYDGEGKLIGLPNFSYFVDGFCTSPRYWWLLYSTMAYCIKGRNLPGEMLPLFQEDRLRSLQCFNAARHEPPCRRLQ